MTSQEPEQLHCTSSIRVIRHNHLLSFKLRLSNLKTLRCLPAPHSAGGGRAITVVVARVVVAAAAEYRSLPEVHILVPTGKPIMACMSKFTVSES
jgi:hypothetical protein